MRRSAWTFLVSAALLACASPRAHALEPGLDMSRYSHAAWRVREGFPKGMVHAIAQTRDGYLWLGTEDGLVRFDGVRPVPWHPRAGEALPVDSVRVLTAASDGALWIGTLSGLASLRAGRITSYPELAGFIINAILEDRSGTIWVTAIGHRGQRVCTIRAGDMRCENRGPDAEPYITSICEDSSGRVWVAATNGLVRVQPRETQTVLVEGGLATTLQAIAAGPEGSVLGVTRTGAVARIAGGKVEVVLGVGATPPARSILRDRAGALWLGTYDQGLVHVHGGRIDRFMRSDGLSSDAAFAMYEDREGNVWVATLEGLDRFSPIAAARLSLRGGVASGAVAAVVAARDGAVWISTSKGLNRLREGRLAAVRGPDVPVRAASLLEDSRGRIWVGALDGVGSFEHGTFVREGAIPAGSVDSIVEDRAGNTWFAVREHGLFMRAPDGAVTRTPWRELGGEDAASRLAADPAGGLWLGFREGGVSHLRDRRVDQSLGRGVGLASGFVRSLRVQPDGTLWATTPSGLVRVKDGRAATLHAANGLPCDSLDWLQEDVAGSFWIYAGCGLVHVERAQWQAWSAAADRGEPESARIRASLLDAADGVTGAGWVGSFAPHAASPSNRELWFVGPDGLVVVDPTQLGFNRIPPPVRIEQVVADRKAFDVEDGSAPRLPPLLRDLEVDYTALSLTAPQKVQFRHRLEGRDEAWQDAGVRRQAFYTDLPPGDYRFHVIAANNSGVWNETGASLAFTIPPAYYQTAWFRAALVIGAAALVWALYLLRLRHLKGQFDMRVRERVGERTRIARELHDTLLQSFQGALLNFHLASLLLPAKPEEAKAKLDEVIDQAGHAIAEGRDAVQGLRASTQVTNDLARDLERLGDELAADPSRTTTPSMRVLVKGGTRDLVPLIRDEVHRIGTEAVRNAFRHSHAQRVDVHIHYDRRYFRLRVRDDGIGMPPEVVAEGGRVGHYGLGGMKERAQLAGGKLEIRSAHGLGTEVVLEIPASRAFQKVRRVAPTSVS